MPKSTSESAGAYWARMKLSAAIERARRPIAETIELIKHRAKLEQLGQVDGPALDLTDDEDAESLVDVALADFLADLRT